MTHTTTGATATDPASVYPVIGQISTTVAAMRAAADLLESAGIAGLSVNCDDQAVTVHVTEDLGDAAARARLVARLAAAIGTTAVRADSTTGPDAWVRAEAEIAGLRFRVFTAIRVQHTDAGPLACDPPRRTAQAASPADDSRLPAGWRWLTDLDPAADAAGRQVSR